MMGSKYGEMPGMFEKYYCIVSLYQRTWVYYVSTRKKDSTISKSPILYHNVSTCNIIQQKYPTVLSSMPPLKECILYVKYFKYVSFFQANFEAMFREYESNATFHYLRSFRRVRVDFEAHLAASRAKLELDGTPLGDNVIHCYFLQVSIYYKSISAKK